MLWNTYITLLSNCTTSISDKWYFNEALPVLGLYCMCEITPTFSDLNKHIEPAEKKNDFNYSKLVNINWF